jgi:hypothetical protein
VKGKGTLGTWRFRESEGASGRRTRMGWTLGRDESIREPKLEGVYVNQHLSLQQVREDLWRKAKVRTGLGKTDRPGSQGGSGKHRLWGN